MSTLLDNDWPVPTDDSGDGNDGTGLTEEFWDALRQCLDDQVTDPGNPTVSPADIISEVVTARGGETNLNNRLNSIQDLVSDAVPAATLETLFLENLCANSTLVLWSQEVTAGVAGTAAPDFFTFTTGGGTITRTGTGLADNQRLPYGQFCCKITYSATAASLKQVLVNSTALAKLTGLKGRGISVGCYIKPSVGGIARIVIYDGVTSTASSYASTSANGTWVTVSATIGVAATEVSIYAEVTGAGSAYFGCFCPTLSALPSADWIPEKVSRSFPKFSVAGNVATGTKKFIMHFSRPCIVVWSQAHLQTGNTGADFVWDVNGWDGAAYTTMYTTKPKILAGASPAIGGSAPDGTYARRCLTVMQGTTFPVGGEMTVDFDTVGSGVAGADLELTISVIYFGSRVFEQFLAEGDIGT